MIAYNLEQALPQANTVQELHLVGRGLRTLPPEIIKCQNLRKIVLRGNQLSSLPLWLQNLALLEELDVSNNPLVSWPTHLGGQLMTLSVQDTGLGLGINTLRSFPKLRSLDCKGCLLEGEVSKLFLPPLLQYLSLQNLGVKELPPCLLGLNALKKLNASHNQLTRFPASLPTSLESLNLSKNRINTGSLKGVFSRLEQLDLSGNRLGKVPNGIWENSPSLETLNLANNRLEQLPVKQPSFIRLRNLDLSKNRLVDLPQSLVQCPHLKTLNLLKNSFTKPPSVLFSWSRLDQLDLSKNKLDELTGDWLQLGQLRGLVLDKNPLTQLPDTLFQMARLQKLSLKAIKVKPSAEQILESPALDRVLPQRGFTPVLTFNRLLRKEKVTARHRSNCWKLRSGDSPPYHWDLVRIGLSSSDSLLRKHTRRWVFRNADRINLQAGSQLFPLGDTGFLREEWSAQLKPLALVKKLENSKAAILLGQGRINPDLIPKTQTPICWPFEVQEWLDRHNGAAALGPNRLRKLEQLLRSRIAADVDLALGILRVHGLPSSLRPSFSLALDQHRGSSLGRRLRSFAQRYSPKQV